MRIGATSAVVSAASSAGAMLALAASPAHALGPVNLELAGEAGYGTTSLGAGLGARAGVSFYGLYAGVNAINNFATRPTGYQGRLQLGAELGFGVRVSFVTIRPLLGVGYSLAAGSGLTEAGAIVDINSVYLQGGGLLLFDLQLGPNNLTIGSIIVGVDASCLILPTALGGALFITSATPAQEAFVMRGQVGVKF